MHLPLLDRRERLQILRRVYRVAFQEWVSADKALFVVCPERADEAAKGVRLASAAYAQARNDLTQEMLATVE